MPWKCPACTQEIRHDPTDDAPRLGVLYRCHVCRMELVLDGTSGALLASKNAVANASQFHIYPEAGHAFAADYRPSYRKADAEDGFKRLHAWFKAHGAG